MRGLWLFRNNFWYLFPGLALRFLIQERKEKLLYLTTLTEGERKEIRKQKRRDLFFFSLSFVLHGLFALGFFYNFLNPVILGKDTFISKEAVDFDIMDGMLSSDLDPVYDENSEFIIKPSALITQREKKDQSLANLLENLRRSKTTGLSTGKISKKSGKYQSKLGQEEQKLKVGLGWKKTKKKISPLRSQLWDRIKTVKSNTTTANVNYGDIMKVIDQHSFQFQECYERGLLKDESLSGKVIFLLKLRQSQVKKAGLELKGKGNPASRKELTRCLFNESKKLTFSNNKGNISIKFNLIFGL